MLALLLSLLSSFVCSPEQCQILFSSIKPKIECVSLSVEVWAFIIMKRIVNKKSHSWWWDGHINPKNSKWMADSLEEVDNHVKEMLKLIEEEGDSFAKKAEMYYQRRPELVSHVEDIYRMYRALAERYDHITGELRKNVPKSPESKSTLTSPSQSLDEEASGDVSPRSPGLKLFHEPVKMGKSISSSSSGSSSESEEVVETDVSLSRIEELEAQLSVANEMTQRLQKDKTSLETEKNLGLEEFRELEEKFAEKEREIDEMGASFLREKNRLCIANGLIQELQLENASLERKNFTLEGSLRAMEDKFREREKEIEGISASLLRENSSLKLKVESQSAASNQFILQLQEEVKTLEMEMQSALEVSLTERKKETENMNASFLREKSRLELEIQQLQQERESLKTEKRSLELEKTTVEETLREREEYIQDLGEKKFLEKFQMELDILHLREKLDASEEVRRNLEMELERERSVVLDVAEKKREAIRQLCFTLQHYRDGYNELRQAILVHRRPPAVLSS